MKRGMIVAVACATVVSTLAGGDALAKSKKYYRYSLKARPAYGSVYGIPKAIFGDHTYVCIENQKKKKGKYRTTKKRCYAHWTAFPETATRGGSTRKKWRVRKKGDAKARKNGAVCTQKSSAALCSGVCTVCAIKNQIACSTLSAKVFILMSTAHSFLITAHRKMLLSVRR